MANMDKEIAIRNQTQDIGSIVASAFVKGQVYSKQEVKKVLQNIYDSLGLNKKAKSTDLADYISCKSVKKDGLKAIRII
jgi:quinolinate synthase